VEELHVVVEEGLEVEALEEGLEVEAVEEGGRYQGSLELTKLSPGETYTAIVGPLGSMERRRTFTFTTATEEPGESERSSLTSPTIPSLEARGVEVEQAVEEVVEQVVESVEEEVGNFTTAVEEAVKEVVEEEEAEDVGAASEEPSVIEPSDDTLVISDENNKTEVTNSGETEADPQENPKVTEAVNDSTEEEPKQEKSVKASANPTVSQSPIFLLAFLCYYNY